MLERAIPLAVAVPLVVAAVLSPLSGKLPRRAADIVSIATSAFVAVLCGALAVASRAHPLVHWFGGWTPSHGVALGISFSVDPIGAGLASFAGLLVTLAFIFSWDYFEPAGTLFYVLMLVFLAAMAGFGLTGDIFNLFVFFELMSVAAFALTGYKIEEEAAIAGAINFAITNSIGAFFVLIGIALLYGRTGALNIAQIASTVASHPPDGLLVIAALLIICGFFVKGALVPFHLWLDDAHAVAPTPLCVLFSGIMVQLAIYAVARLYWTIFVIPFHGHDGPLRALLVAVGIVTALVGALMAFSQRHFKRLLAFSTISHSGLFVCGLAAFSALGIAAVAVFVVAHGLVKASLFMGAGIVLHRRGSVNEVELHGKCTRMPATAILLILGALALAGLPPFGISSGKTLLEHAMHDANLGWLAAIFFIASALDGAAVLRFTASVFFGVGRIESDGGGQTPSSEKRETDRAQSHTPATMLVAAYAGLLLALAAGTIPSFIDTAGIAASQFVHAWSALDLSTTAVRDVLLNVATASAAVALAVMGLYVPSYAKRLSWLRSMHDGVFTDYAVWMLVGVAIYGVVLVRIAI